MKLLTLICCIAALIQSSSDIHAQTALNRADYKTYKFEEFLEIHTTSPREYIEQLYSNLKFPTDVASRKSYEGTLSILLTNHDKNNVKTKALNKLGDHDKTIIQVIEETNKNHLVRSEEKYTTLIKIKFDYEPHDAYVEDDIIKVLGSKPISCGPWVPTDSTSNH